MCGKTIDLVIDSGATNSAVSERTAELLKLKMRPNGVVKGTSLAGLRRQMGTLPPLSIGGLTTAGFDVDVFDFQPFIKDTSHEMDELHGMIGSNLLTAYGAIIDYSKRVLYLKDQSRYDLRCLQGTWRLESFADGGKVDTDPQFLAKCSITITGQTWKLVFGAQTEVGHITPDATGVPKVFGISSIIVNDAPVRRGDKVLPPGEYAYALPYDVSWTRFRYARASRDAESLEPTGLTSTPTNKTTVLTWVRAP